MALCLPAAITPTLAILGSNDSYPVGRVFCAGRNYPWPDAQVGALRAPPVFFMKPATAVLPAGSTLTYPPATADLCHEVELVVAIGREAAHLDADQAAEHIWGYAVGLDLTRRDLQQHARRHGQPWEAAKAFDGSAPCSALAPTARVGHPSTGGIWLTVNGVERQRADLADQLWQVPDLLAALSRLFTLRPGDLVFTGTPFGVGVLWPGDEVSAGIDGIGQLSLKVAPSLHPNLPNFPRSDA